MIAGAFIYATLFYHQQACINFLLFSLFLVGALLIKDKLLLTKPSWLAVSIACTASSLCVLVSVNSLFALLNLFDANLILQRINYENLSGIVLFSLLNILILFLNGIDFYSILSSNGLPEGMTHSELVHQGVELLIVSILIAISIILFYFRGALNF